MTYYVRFCGLVAAMLALGVVVGWCVRTVSPKAEKKPRYKITLYGSGPEPRTWHCYQFPQTMYQTAPSWKFWDATTSLEVIVPTTVVIEELPHN